MRTRLLTTRRWKKGSKAPTANKQRSAPGMGEVHVGVYSSMKKWARALRRGKLNR